MSLTSEKNNKRLKLKIKNKTLKQNDKNRCFNQVLLFIVLLFKDFYYY